VSDTPIWEVVLYVDGPVTVRRHIRTTQQKGFRLEDPFYSDIEIAGQPSGLRATVTARAPDHTLAYKAAVFFFGHMLDALTLSVNRPMYLSLTERERSYGQRHNVRRIIEPAQIEHAFSEAYFLARGSPSILRSLGWYRKGLTTEDPLDRFLAFWNAIEIVASKYYHYVPSIDKERAKKGSKNQVWACFEASWGPCSGWPVIPGETKWIDESYAVRLDVAHGVAFINVHKVGEVAERLPTIEDLSYRFLKGWRERFLELDRQAPSESLPDTLRELLPE
jgi:hypothetical protein